MFLREARILVVEDQYILASQLERRLREDGAIVVGPEPDVARALRRLRDATRVDAAVLDLHLGDGESLPIADALARRGIPFVFLTGYDSQLVHRHFPRAPVLTKPTDPGKLRDALLALIGAAR